MKALVAFLLVSTAAMAAPENFKEIPVLRNQLGSGTPAEITVGHQAARLVSDGLYHTPQYMAGFPTAATIWPRAVNVACTRNQRGGVACDGYHWLPNMGRGEYLFVVPHVKDEPAPVEPKTIVVFKEVPRKKKAE